MTSSLPFRARFCRLTQSSICMALVLALQLSSMLPALAVAQQFDGTLRLQVDGFCAMHDNSVGMRTVHVIHLPNPGTVASRFKLVSDPGVTLTYVSETNHVGVTLGNTQDGITVCYGSCLAGADLLVSVSYMAFGTSENCSQIRIVPHPSAETVDAIRCDNTPIGSYISDLYVTAVFGDCGCPPIHSFPGSPESFSCESTPARSTTWGAIKALYAN